MSTDKGKRYVIIYATIEIRNGKDEPVIHPGKQTDDLGYGMKAVDKLRDSVGFFSVILWDNENRKICYH